MLEALAGATTMGRLAVNGHCSFSSCPPTARQNGYGVSPSFKPNFDSQEVVSGIRCALIKMLLVPIAGEIAKVCYDTVGALVVYLKTFCDANHCSIWVPQNHR